MTKGVQGNPRERLHTFFREIVMGEPGIDRALADRVAERCVKHIDLLLEWDRNRGSRTAAVSPNLAQQLLRQPGSEAQSAAIAHVGPLRGSSQIKPVAATSAPSSVSRPFDPYAFSVVVTLVKKGPDALLARLAEIKEVENLRLLANAQHLGIDQKIAQADDLRHAILQGAERRVAGRRAAAS